MAEGRSLAQDVNNWVQTVAIFGAGIWALYTFWYQAREVKSAPVNITLDLQLKKIGSDQRTSANNGKGLVPIEVKVSARNPSSRTVYLLPSAWIAWGSKIVSTTQPKPIRDFKITGDTDDRRIELHVSNGEREVVGVGRLFQRDDSLRPGEIITRTLIIYVPPNEYNEVAVRTILQTVVKENALDLNWELNSEKKDFDERFYSLGPNGKRTEIKADANGFHFDPALEVQGFDSDSAIALTQ
jgi:hypothetical protein